jgi:hypothetical protein
LRDILSPSSLSLVFSPLRAGRSSSCERPCSLCPLPPPLHAVPAPLGAPLLAMAGARLPAPSLQRRPCLPGGRSQIFFLSCARPLGRPSPSHAAPPQLVAPSRACPCAPLSLSPFSSSRSSLLLPQMVPPCSSSLVDHPCSPWPSLSTRRGRFPSRVAVLSRLPAEVSPDCVLDLAPCARPWSPVCPCARPPARRDGSSPLAERRSPICHGQSIDVPLQQPVVKLQCLSLIPGRLRPLSCRRRSVTPPRCRPLSCCLRLVFALTKESQEDVEKQAPSRCPQVLNESPEQGSSSFLRSSSNMERFQELWIEEKVKLCSILVRYLIEDFNRRLSSFSQILS